MKGERHWNVLIKLEAKAAQVTPDRPQQAVLQLLPPRVSSFGISPKHQRSQTQGQVWQGHRAPEHPCHGDTHSHSESTGAHGEREAGATTVWPAGPAEMLSLVLVCLHLAPMAHPALLPRKHHYSSWPHLMAFTLGVGCKTCTAPGCPNSLPPKLHPKEESTNLHECQAGVQQQLHLIKIPTRDLPGRVTRLLKYFLLCMNNFTFVPLSCNGKFLLLFFS